MGRLKDMDATKERTAALFALTVFVAGCGDSGVPAGEAWSVRDSATVHIATSTRPAWEGWEVGGALLTIGGGATGDLFDVTGGVLLPDGGVAVALGGSSEVRFYDDDGALRGAWGGRGDGPDEFRLLAGIGRAGGDTVWAYDFGAARMSLLTPAGGVVGSVALRPPLPAGNLVGRRSDGSLVVGQLWGSGPPRAREVEGLVRDPAAWVGYTPDGMLADTLGLFPGREVLHRLEGSRMTMGVAPFARTASSTLLGDDLVVGDQVRRELSVVGAASTLRVRWSGPPLDVTGRDVEAWKDAQVAAAEAADRPSVRAYLADVPMPDRRPAYGSVLVGADGSIWVAAYAPPGQVPAAWDVFDREGRWLATVPAPARFRLLDAAEDRLLGVSRDELDVERVEVRRLVRTTGTSR